MSTFRSIKNSNYTMINQTAINDKNLSFRAKGILLFAHSCNNEFSLNEILKYSKEGKDSVLSALKELENAGYLKQIEKSFWVFVSTENNE